MAVSVVNAEHSGYPAGRLVRSRIRQNLARLYLDWFKDQSLATSATSVLISRGFRTSRVEQQREKPALHFIAVGDCRYALQQRFV